MQGEFEKHTREANEFINAVAGKLQVTPKIAYQAVKSVFFTLREVITANESLNLVSQLPMFLKAVYVDGWKLSESANYKNINSKDEFLSEITAKYKQIARATDVNEVSSILSFESIFDLLTRYVSDGELQDIKDQLPEEVKELIPA